MAHMLQLIRTMGRGDYLKDLGKKGQSAAMARPAYEPRKSLSPRSPKKSGDYLKDLGRKGMAAQLDDPAPRAASRAARAPAKAAADPWGIERTVTPAPVAPASGGSSTAPIPAEYRLHPYGRSGPNSRRA